MTIYPQNKGPVSRKWDHAQLLIKREDDPLWHQRCTTDGRSATGLAKWCCRHNVIRTRWLPTLSVDKHTCEKEHGKTRRNQHCSASAMVRRRNEQLLILHRPYRVRGNDYYTSKKMLDTRGTWCSHLTFLFEYLCVSNTAHIQAAQRKGLFQQRKQSRVFNHRRDVNTPVISINRIWQW